MFKLPVLKALYDLQSGVWQVVAADTVVYLIDKDNEIYKKVMTTTYNSVLINILICFTLGNVVIYLFWRIRRKIFTVYSILDKVMPFEFKLAQDRLTKSDAFI